jgi:PAS domain S-box-containing protein
MGIRKTTPALKPEETHRDGRSLRGKILNNAHERQQSKHVPGISNKKTLQALRKSENEKQTLLDGLRDLVRVRYLSPDFRIIWTNTDPVQGSEMADETTSPVYCYALLHGRTEPCPNCEAKEALEQKCFFENKESRPDEDRHFIARGIPVRDSQGRILGVIHIALNITKYKETEDGLKITNAFLRSLLENSPTPICVSDADGRISTINNAWVNTLELSKNRTVGKQFHDIFSKDVAARINSMHQRILESNIPAESEESIECSTGLHHFHTVMFPLRDTTGKTSAVGSILLDVTGRKQAEQALMEREMELRAKSVQLEETNIALKVLLRQREEDQRELQERIQSNIRELVLPYLNKLQGTRLNDVQAGYMDVAVTHLKEITAPFLRHTVSLYPQMTAKELQVATHVREGRSNKEIAGLMGVSLNTIEIHRYNLRRKLSIQNKKINLRSFLLSLNKQDLKP